MRKDRRSEGMLRGVVLSQKLREQGFPAPRVHLSGWFARPCRRMADWEATAALWHRQVVPRFLAWKEWESALVG